MTAVDDMWAVVDWAANLCSLAVRLQTIEGEARLAMADACPLTGILAVDQPVYEYGYYAGVADLAALLTRKVES